MKRPSIEKSIIIAGLLIAIVGFGAHFFDPGTSGSEIGTFVSPYGTKVIHVQTSTYGGPYSFRMDILGPEIGRDPYCKVYVLGYSEYDQYENYGIPLEDLNHVYYFENQSRGIYTADVVFVDYYIVILNYENATYGWNCYYSALSDQHFPTLLVGFSGIMVLLVGLFLYLDGWKRYFIVGTMINLLFFILRTTTLVRYSLGLPDIFYSTFHVELYNDYQYFYLSWVPQIWEGAYPYGGDLYYYIYGPLWIYIVSLFGSVPSWLPGVSLFTFNIATGIVVHQIVQRLSCDDKKAIFAMMLYLLNPITVMYGSFMWLNPTIYTFFCSLSLMFALDDKGGYAIGALAVATLVKQFAVIFFPLLSIYLIKKYQCTLKEGVRKFLEHTLLFVGVVLIGSLPFLLYDAEGYIFWMVLANTGVGDRLYVFIPDLWMPVHFNTFFLWLTGPTALTDAIAFLLSWFVPLIICAILIYGGYVFFKPIIEEADNFQTRSKRLFTQLILLAFLAVLSVQIFYPRGAYKFYLLTLMPFATILFDFKDFHFQNRDEFKIRPHHFLTLLLSFGVFFWYRFVYFWILVLWGLFYFYQNRQLLSSSEYFQPEPHSDDYVSLVEESLIEEVESGQSD